MKRMKRLLAALLVLALVLVCVPVTAFAASYPLIFVDYDKTPDTIMKGETGQLCFKIFPEYHNEKYHVYIYDSHNNKVATAENTYYNTDGTITRNVTITVDTADLDLEVGTYKAVYWLSYYSFQSWHDAPNQYTYYFKVTPYVCTGAHVYDSVCDANCNACGAERSVTHTYGGSCDSSCDICGAIRTATGSHTFASSADDTCDVCGYKRVAIEEDNSAIVNSGKCGSNVTWTLTKNGTLTISGTGNMYGYSYDSKAPWYNYDVKNAYIAEGVTSVGNYAFYYSDVEKVSIPSTVTKIGEDCFSNCRTLREIILPDGIKTIPKYAFSDCSSLESINIPASVQSFGTSCFEDCTSLEYFIIPEGVEKTANGMFWGCSALEYVQIPASVTEIDTFTFHDCGNLSDVYYGGTQSQYQEIEIDSLDKYNEGLKYATIHYSSKAPCKVHTMGGWTQGDDAQHVKNCVNCGYSESAAHTWDTGSITKAATCQETGVKTYTCTVCRKTQTETLPKTDHSWKGTCNKKQRCSVCNVASSKPIGHIYDDGWDGTCNVCNVHRETTEKRTVMHMFRMYDPNSGEHFYTGSEAERDFLVSVGWNYEGVGFTFSRTTGMPVYRLYDPVYGEHLYTMDPAERDALIAQGWNLEGIAFNSAYNTEVPQYRLHNPNAKRGAYHFTASEAERDMLIALGWEYQGIGFYSSWK